MLQQETASTTNGRSGSLLVESSQHSSPPLEKSRIYIHDYAGHVSQMEIARALAGRGYPVTFTYCDELTTPRASMDDPNLRVRPISLGRQVNKQNYIVRQWQDIQYGKALVRDISSAPCDMVLSCNTPLFPEAALLRYCRRHRVPLIHWWSEVYSHAVKDGLRRKSKFASRIIGGFYERLERKLLKNSAAVISVCHGAAEVARSWDPTIDVTVIPVAAPVDGIHPTSKDNPWARRHGLGETFNIVYAGTLGIKHRPELLSRLASEMSDRADVRVVVVSEGSGAEFLAREKSERQLDNLRLFPFQPFDEYQNVLGAADIQVTILQADASRYSMPSKFASQLCSGKPQVAVVPGDNDAARMIRHADAGLISEPDDFDSFYRNILRLLESEEQRHRLGRQGREYVEAKLHVDKLLGDFEAVIERVLRETPPIQLHQSVHADGHVARKPR